MWASSGPGSTLHTRIRPSVSSGLASFSPSLRPVSSSVSPITLFCRAGEENNGREMGGHFEGCPSTQRPEKGKWSLKRYQFNLGGKPETDPRGESTSNPESLMGGGTQGPVCNSLSLFFSLLLCLSGTDLVEGCVTPTPARAHAGGHRKGNQTPLPFLLTAK